MCTDVWGNGQMCRGAPLGPEVLRHMQNLGEGGKGHKCHSYLGEKLKEKVFIILKDGAFLITAAVCCLMSGFSLYG